MSTDTHEVMTRSIIMPVLVIEQVEDAVPLAQALKAGGLSTLEVTLRTDAALAAIERIANEVEDVLVGAGTVLSPDDLASVARVGGQFAISPGATKSLLTEGLATELPYLPAVSTVSEVMRACEYGYRAFKFFPAEASGGVAALKSFYGPLPDLHFCPTGGIGEQNYRSYLRLPNVSVVGGSWIVPADLLARRDWAGITECAAAAVAGAEN